MPPQIFHKIEQYSKRVWIRVLLISISVAISAIYTNESKRSIQKSNDQCVEQNTVLAAKVRNLENQTETLKNNMLVLSLVDDNFPNPQWMKSVDFMMLKLNKSYEKVFLEPYGKKRSDYIGKYDYDVWDKEIAEAFRHNDLMVLEAGRPVSFKERVWLDGRFREVEVVKYPIKVNNVIVGIGGYVEMDYN